MYKDINNRYNNMCYKIFCQWWKLFIHCLYPRHSCDTRVCSGLFQVTPVTPEFILEFSKTLLWHQSLFWSFFPRTILWHHSLFWSFPDPPAPLLDWDWWTPPQEWFFSDFQGIPVQTERREQPRWEIPIHAPHAVIPHFPFTSLDFISYYYHKINRNNIFFIKEQVKEWQGSCGCPSPGIIPGQVGQGLEKAPWRVPSIPWSSSVSTNKNMGITSCKCSCSSWSRDHFSWIINMNNQQLLQAQLAVSEGTAAKAWWAALIRALL